MSPINFDRLQADYPEYGPIWSALREWFGRNWQKRYVELAVLARALKEKVHPINLLAAIKLMIDENMLRAAYRVRVDGDLLEGSFDAPDEIPDRMWTRDSSRKVRTDDGELVNGYRWGPTDAA